MKRRDVLKGAALSVVAATAAAQEPKGPYSLPTQRFKAGAQHEFPPHAFQADLPYPPVPRPTAIGTWKELMEGTLKDRAFGPGDSTPIGDCFHGIAREWGETLPHWEAYGCNAHLVEWEAWKNKEASFGRIERHDAADVSDPSKKYLYNWGGGESGLPIKCYKIPMLETYRQLPELRHPTRFYSYAGLIPGPTLKMRLGQPVVVRFENHLETETSIHLHGGHSPSHSDGFPSFYVLQGKARDYFYPNILPLYKKNGKYLPDRGESQSTMWYHDHAMDATAYNVSKGLSGFAPCFGEEELGLIRRGVLPGLGRVSCEDKELHGFVTKTMPGIGVVPDPDFEDPLNPGFYKHEAGFEPYFNPYDLPIVLQDRVFDPKTGQIAYDNTGHNGYIGETMVINGVPWPKAVVERRKYRLRILDGSNARVFRIRLMSAENFYAANQHGIDVIPVSDHTIPPVVDENDPAAIKRRPSRYDAASESYLRIGKDSWLWSHAKSMKAMTLTMANRADVIVDFGKLTEGLEEGETREFFLVNTMPQFDGRGPKQKLDDGGDPRVLPVPFDVENVEGVEDLRLVEANRPIPLMKFVVTGPAIPKEQDASVEDGTELITTHRPIEDHEIKAVREFIFERGKGAWQINGRFYDPTIANAGPILDGAEEWVLRNGGGGWWHPIHIHLESHQLVRYEKDFAADAIIDRQDPPAPVRLGDLTDLIGALPKSERLGLHDTTALGPNTVARIRMRHRTWNGPFVFHCHNVEHEDMRMMFNFEPVPEHTTPEDKLPNIAPTARTHGNDVTWIRHPDEPDGRRVGELAWEYPPIPQTPVTDAGEDLIPPRPKTRP